MVRSSRRLGIAGCQVVVVAFALAGLPAAAAFQGPLFGLATAPNGELLAADASIGIVVARDDAPGRQIPLVGVSDMAPLGTASMWAVTGANAPNGLNDTGQGLHRVSNGTTRKIANLFEFESTHNPDGGAVESNPFDIHALGGDAAIVADAAGNDLLVFDGRGNGRVLAVFPNEVVSTANIKQLAGCPSPAPFCQLPPMIPAQPVPTSIAVRDGDIFVGELKGFPAPTGESNIWRVSAGADAAQCGASPDCVKVFDGGFTSILDLAFGPDGRLYVAEMDEASWAAVEIFHAPTGGTIQACDVDAGTCEVVASGIPVLTAITFGKDGSLWATRNALAPGGAEVVRILP